MSYSSNNIRRVLFARWRAACHAPRAARSCHSRRSYSESTRSSAFARLASSSSSSSSSLPLLTSVDSTSPRTAPTRARCSWCSWVCSRWRPSSAAASSSYSAFKNSRTTTKTKSFIRLLCIFVKLQVDWQRLDRRLLRVLGDDEHAQAPAMQQLESK